MLTKQGLLHVEDLPQRFRGSTLKRRPVSSNMVTHMKTTVEIADALADEAKRIAARDKTTLRALLEAGLRHVIEQRRNESPFLLRDASFAGNGLQPGVREGDWEQIRDLAYEGRGS